MTEQIQNDSGGRTAAGPASVASLEQLVAIRQAAGLGASDIASRMGMATRQIEALERGDWGRLPGQAFVRAALRAYGKSLDVDVGPLLATIGGQATGGVPELKAAASLESPIPRAGGSGFGLGGRLGWIVLGLAAVIAIVFYFGPAFEHKESGQTEAPAATGSADSAGPEAGVRSSGSGSGTPAAAAGAGIVAGDAGIGRGYDTDHSCRIRALRAGPGRCGRECRDSRAGAGAVRATDIGDRA